MSQHRHPRRLGSLAALLALAFVSTAPLLAAAAASCPMTRCPGLENAAMGPALCCGLVAPAAAVPLTDLGLRPLALAHSLNAFLPATPRGLRGAAPLPSAGHPDLQSLLGVLRI